jgi:hypothetical protein
MPRKPKPKWDDPEESKRFLEAAKVAEASNDSKDFDRAFKAVVSKKKIGRLPHPNSE